MRDPQTTSEFWDEQHSIGHLGNLSGYSAEGELGDLRARHLVRPGIKVLNIGLGMGYTTEHLIASGCEVSIHDISKVALKKFSGRVAGAYLPEDLPKLPTRYFDLALSHLVMQHMCDEALVPQVRHVIRSLAPAGVFACQFVVAWAQTEPSFRYSTEVEEALPYCRSLHWMSGIIEDAGGMIVSAELSENFPQYRFGWYVVHAIRQDSFPQYVARLR
ncbi:MAG: methyltransferase domain-containing protein [Acidobacteriota bacterium]|nr:methyltransferase domain-containing protein [Acidobacteriota bacterium]